jgi:hypothetical protein
MKILQRTTTETVDEYSSKRKIVKIVCRKKKRTKEREKLEKLKIGFEFYKGINEIKTGFKHRIEFCKDKEGNLLGNRQTILVDGPGILRGC